jgi:hypothetical protein
LNPVTRRALRIRPGDNVAVALEDISGGELVRVEGDGPAVELEARSAVPFAHKIALGEIARGQAILKYEAPIAFAAADILPGDWVHAHNAESYAAARRAEASR